MKINIMYNILKKYKFLLFLVFFFKLIFDLMSVYLLPYILRILGDEYQANTLTTNTAILLAFLYSLFFSIERLIGAAVMPRLFYKSVYKIEVELREKLFCYVIKHSTNFFNNNMAGTIASRINNIAKNVQFIVFRISEILSGIIIFTSAVILYFKINFYLGLFLVLWTIIFFISEYFLGKINYRTVNKIIKERNIVSGMITDNFANILNIKIFSNQRNESKNIKKQGIRILQMESKALWARTFTNMAMFILSSSLIFFVIGISFTMVIKKELTIGTFLFICQNIIMASFIIKDMFNNSTDLIIKLSESREGLDNLLKPIDISNRKGARKLENVNGKIVFKNINFNYR